MTVEDTNVVDFIHLSEDGVVQLTISDHLDWSEMEEHLLLLQEKLHAYLDFIEDGQVYTSYPNLVGREFMIQIYFKYLPTGLALSFLEKVEERLTESNYRFSWIHLVE